MQSGLHPYLQRIVLDYIGIPILTRVVDQLKARDTNELKRQDLLIINKFQNMQTLRLAEHLFYLTAFIKKNKNFILEKLPQNLFPNPSVLDDFINNDHNNLTWDEFKNICIGILKIDHYLSIFDISTAKQLHVIYHELEPKKVLELLDFKNNNCVPTLEKCLELGMEINSDDYAQLIRISSQNLPSTYRENFKNIQTTINKYSPELLQKNVIEIARIMKGNFNLTKYLKHFLENSITLPDDIIILAMPYFRSRGDEEKQCCIALLRHPQFIYFLSIHNTNNAYQNCFDIISYAISKSYYKDIENQIIQLLSKPRFISSKICIALKNSCTEMLINSAIRVKNFPIILKLLKLGFVWSNEFQLSTHSSQYLNNNWQHIELIINEIRKRDDLQLHYETMFSDFRKIFYMSHPCAKAIYYFMNAGVNFADDLSKYLLEFLTNVNKSDFFRNNVKDIHDVISWIWKHPRFKSDIYGLPKNDFISLLEQLIKNRYKYTYNLFQDPKFLNSKNFTNLQDNLAATHLLLTTALGSGQIELTIQLLDVGFQFARSEEIQISEIDPESKKQLNSTTYYSPFSFAYEKKHYALFARLIRFFSYEITFKMLCNEMECFRKEATTDSKENNCFREAVISSFKEAESFRETAIANFKEIISWDRHHAKSWIKENENELLSLQGLKIYELIATLDVNLILPILPKLLFLPFILNKEEPNKMVFFKTLINLGLPLPRHHTAGSGYIYNPLALYIYENFDFWQTDEFISTLQLLIKHPEASIWITEKVDDCNFAKNEDKNITFFEKNVSSDSRINQTLLEHPACRKQIEDEEVLHRLVATKPNNTKAIEAIVAKIPTELEHKNAKGETPLAIALAHDNLAVFAGAPLPIPSWFLNISQNVLEAKDDSNNNTSETKETSHNPVFMAELKKYQTALKYKTKQEYVNAWELLKTIDFKLLANYFISYEMRIHLVSNVISIAIKKEISNPINNLGQFLSSPPKCENQEGLLNFINEHEAKPNSNQRCTLANINVRINRLSNEKLKNEILDLIKPILANIDLYYPRYFKRKGPPRICIPINEPRNINLPYFDIDSQHQQSVVKAMFCR